MSSVPASLRMVPPVPDGATRVVLVRHGEAVCNVSGVVGGVRGCTGLSPAGRLQAESLRRRLAETGALASATALYASVLPRALETAAILAPVVGSGRLEVEADCGLCELHPGEGDGLTWPEFVERFGEPDWDADPDTVLAPGGESWRGFVERASTSLVELAARHRGSAVVVVCHAGVIEAAMLRFVAGSPDGRLKLRTAHASITEFEREGPDGPWRLLRYNDAAHLPG